MTPSQGPASLRRRVFTPRPLAIVRFASGAILGAGLFVWTHQFLATFGCSLPVTAGMTMALAVGVSAAWWGLAQRHVVASIEPYIRAAAWLTVAIWSIGYPGLLAIGAELISRIPVHWLEVEATSFLLLFLAGVGLMVIPAAAVTCVASGPDGDAGSRGLLSVPCGVGCGVGLGAAPVLWARWMAVEHIGYLVAVIGALAFWVRLQQAVHSEDEPTKPRVEPAGTKSLNWSGLSWVSTISLLAGLLLPVVVRLVMPFIPSCSFSCYALWSGLICGTAAGVAWAVRVLNHRRDIAGPDGVLMAGLLLCVWPVVLLLASPLSLEAMLTLNAFVSRVWVLTAVRWLLPLTATIPLGIAVGRAWSLPAADGGCSVRMIAGAAGCLCLAAGTILMESLWVAPAISLALLVFAIITLVAARFWTRRGTAIGRKEAIRAAWAAGVLALLPLAASQHRPDLAARLLFSTQTFAARHAGFDRDLLPHLDDGRLVELCNGRDGVWTLWKHRGSQLLIRRNGLPMGIVSTNPRLCPQFAGDVMPAVVPLVVHPQPDRVLVLGLGSTAMLTTCLACPVQEVTCLEGDGDLIRINDEVIAAMSGFNPLHDDRVELLNIDPTLALAARGGRYDVVIIGDAVPYLLDQSSRYTREFYERVRSHLQPQGMVCQRLQYADFGRWPIESALCTLRSVFPQVFCLESAPGEMLLLASNSAEPLFDKSLIARCEAAHVRRMLAQLGWDWSVLLNMAAIGPEQVDALLVRGVPINTIGNGAFACRLPQEVMRWGPKWREIQHLLAERGGRMLAWVGDCPEVQEILRRLEDMNEQHRLIVEHPDHYWAYRKALKDRLKERPRSVIQQVHHELQRTLHPEDERRKEYLEVLGAAATSEHPAPSDIERMSKFAEPYDPLVSYFLHEEAARLYERASVDHPQAQFDHLRYSVHFGPLQDRSVRNVVAALELLIDHPQLIPDSPQRWDELNGLLDVLRQRSALRVESDRTASQFELVDAEKSIQTAQRAMRVMDSLCEEAGVDPRDWHRRRTVLERMLIRPMWTYHGKQAARIAALDALKHKTANGLDEPQETR